MADRSQVSRRAALASVVSTLAISPAVAVGALAPDPDAALLDLLADLRQLRPQIEATIQMMVDTLDIVDAPAEDLEDGDDDTDIVDQPHDEETDFQHENQEDEPDFEGKTFEDSETIAAARTETEARLHRILRGRNHPLARPVVEGAI